MYVVFKILDLLRTALDAGKKLPTFGDINLATLFVVSTEYLANCVIELITCKAQI